MNFKNVHGEMRLNEPLAAHTSFRIGGPADALVTPADREDLVALLREVRAKKLDAVVLGSGCNLLVRDGGFRGVVISLRNLNAIAITREYRSVGGAYAVLIAEAGVSLARLLSFALEKGLTGMEFAAGIPGTVGGALCMNAGTAQGEMGDVVDSVTLLSPEGETVLRHRDEMAFGYRTASVPAGHVILDAKVILRFGDKDRIRSHVKEIIEKRKARQPLGLPNAGSVFKNPLDEAAGRLIESAGLKGLTIGRAQVSEKHANFIVNLGGATAADVIRLMETVKERVLEVHKVRLEPEIRIIGEETEG
jgi:UDP-N-acetylmuramate dehydrogenase